MKVLMLNQPTPETDVPGVSEKVRTGLTDLRVQTKHGGMCRLRIVYTPADGVSRRQTNGPCLSGPYASTFPLPVVIDTGLAAEKDAEALIWDAVVGDRFWMDGLVWELRDDVPLEYPRLVPVADPWGNPVDFEKSLENA
jgi:hypothetical protein